MDVDPEELAELMLVLGRLRPKVQEMEARLASAAVAMNDALGRIDQFTAVCRSIAEIHSPRGTLMRYCTTCGCEWPCATASALQRLESR